MISLKEAKAGRTLSGFLLGLFQLLLQIQLLLELMNLHL